MNDFPPGVPLAVYGPGRFPADEPFAEHGYLFTVPSSYPDNAPANTNVADWDMAVYLTGDDGDAWEVRDVDGSRRVWATAGSRREAIRLAFLEIARKHRLDAAELFTVDGSDYGPYLARPVSASWGPYEPISVSRATAEQIAHDLNTLNAGCGLTAQWNGADLSFAWDQRYRDDNGTQTVTPDTDDWYQIGGLWPWMRWTDRR